MGRKLCLFFEEVEFLWGLMSRSCGGLILLIFPGDETFSQAFLLLSLGSRLFQAKPLLL